MDEVADGVAGEGFLGDATQVLEAPVDRFDGVVTPQELGLRIGSALYEEFIASVRAKGKRVAFVTR